jgi:hypothetical protein
VRSTRGSGISRRVLRRSIRLLAADLGSGIPSVSQNCPKSILLVIIIRAILDA